MIELRDKTCLWCQKALLPRGTEAQTSERFQKKMYCSHPCSRLLRQKVRNKTPLPAHVTAELEKRRNLGRIDVPDFSLRDQPTISATQGPIRGRF